MSKFWAIINNQYVVIRKIGSGGFATVYKAWDNMLHKTVAIKKIHTEYSNDSKYVDMFRKEATNTAKLEHENIVRVVNFRYEEGGFYMVMDYVKGMDLEHLLKRCIRDSTVIPLEISLYIFAEILKALDYAHNVEDEFTGRNLGIIHRDLSPGNIMLYFDGRIKLTDFGIARVGTRENRERRSHKEKLKGKISYMSPEQAQLKDIDARSDLFSCGIVLYELLSGKRAFKGTDDFRIWQEVRKANIDLGRLGGDVPKEIKKIVIKLLRKSPEKRYKTASQVFIDLKRYLGKKGTTEASVEKYTRFIRHSFSREIKDFKDEMRRDAKVISSQLFKKFMN
ncbi:MAG: serine/threonine protein kinase [Elusimicrobia bacterium]|nr:serine/threonine protein kinase [Elusimicrobiota bacterium]